MDKFLDLMTIETDVGERCSEEKARYQVLEKRVKTENQGENARFSGLI